MGLEADHTDYESLMTVWSGAYEVIKVGASTYPFREGVARSCDKNVLILSCG